MTIPASAADSYGSIPKAIPSYAHKALLERPVSRALKFMVGLAIPIGLIETLLQLYPTSEKNTLAIARKVIACDARFDYVLFDFLQQPRLTDIIGEVNFFHVELEILDGISPGDRMAPYVLRMLRHSKSESSLESGALCR